MEAFVNHEFYVNTYGGVDIPPSLSFDALALKASFEVNHCTLERAQKVIGDDSNHDLVLKIRMATCAVIEILVGNENSQMSTLGITSEKIGDHSVSYAGVDVMANYAKQQTYMAIDKYLALTGLMFTGVG